MVGKFLLHPPFRRNGRLLGVRYFLGDLGEQNSRVFRRPEKNPSDVGSFIKFHVSLWVRCGRAFVIIQ